MNTAVSPKRPYGFSIDAIMGNTNNARHSTIGSGHLNIAKYSKDRPRDSRPDNVHCAHLTSTPPPPRKSEFPYSGKQDDDEDEEAEEGRTAVGTIENRVPVTHPHLPSSAQLKSPLTPLTLRPQDRGRGEAGGESGLPLPAGLAARHCPELLAVRSLWGLTARATAAPHLSSLLGPTLGASGLPPPHSFGSPFPPTVAAGLSLSHGLLSAGGRDPLSVYPWLLARPGHCYGYTYPGSPEASFLFHPYRKPKRIRTAFSPSQLLKLEQAFERNHYVVGQERKDLASKLGLTETQVKVWFQNRRTKYKRMKSEEDGGDVNGHKAHNSPETPGTGEEVEAEKEEECAQNNEEELELVDSHEEEEESPMNCTMSSLT